MNYSFSSPEQENNLAIAKSFYADNPDATITPDQNGLNYWANELATKPVKQVQADFNYAVAAYVRQEADNKAAKLEAHAKDVANAADIAAKSVTLSTSGTAVLLEVQANNAAADAQAAAQAADAARIEELTLAQDAANAAADQKAIEGHVTALSIQTAYDRALVLSWYEQHHANPDEAGIIYWCEQLNHKTDAEVQADFDWAVSHAAATATITKATVKTVAPNSAIVTSPATKNLTTTSQNVLFSVNNPIPNVMSDEEKRNLVLSWYKENQKATKTPDDAAISYWVSQLTNKTSAQVFMDFTNSVNAVTKSTMTTVPSGFNVTTAIAAVAAFLLLRG